MTALSIPVRELINLFAVLLVMGMLLLLPLFSFSGRRLVRSSLFVKTFMWIPIFAGLVAVLYMDSLWRWGIVLALDSLAYLELRRRLHQQPSHRTMLSLFYAAFVVCSLSLGLAGLSFDEQRAVDFLITVCFASALSDVTAFFMGKYLGRHKLPAQLNHQKSWEGVAGQLSGALLGVLLLQAFGISSIFWLWLPVGLGSALGDLTNSYVKRQLDIKDWSHTIPGHGGYLDRFASLFGGLAVAYYALLLLG